MAIHLVERAVIEYIDFGPRPRGLYGLWFALVDLGRKALVWWYTRYGSYRPDIGQEMAVIRKDD